MLKLWKHQKEGIKFLRSSSRAILADEMGVMKTAQAIIAAGTSKTLVICPASVKGVWEQEWNTWILDAKAVRGSSFTIESYGRARHHYKDEVGTLILDEAHYLKNRKSLRSKTISSLIGYTKPARIWMLTGTPLLNNVGEIWNLLNLLEPWKRGRYWDFLEKYSFVSVNEWGGWEYSGVRNSDYLRASVEHLWLRRLKKEVLKDLPELTRQFLDILPPKNIRKLEDDIMSEKGFLKYQHVTYENKKETVKELLSNCDSFVVFVWHRDIAKKYADLLGATCITGETSIKKRADLVASRPKKVVATIESCGVGISFAQCSRVIFAELSFVPTKLIQAESRLHRPGQKNAVNSYFLVTPLDYGVIRILREKVDNVSLVLNEERELEV